MDRRKQFSLPGDWVVFGWIAFMHIGALAAFWTFSWKNVALAVFFWWLTGGIGICLGYHRYFTHRSFTTPKFVEYFLAVIGTLAGEAGPIAWVAAHRYHHTFSDKEQDPHSPYKPFSGAKGFLWAHMGWLVGREKNLNTLEACKRYTPDMSKDRFLLWLDKFHIFPSLAVTFVLYLIGGWPFVVWGLFVRSVLTYHSTWLVNSAAHVWGYRTYKSGDLSTNNWWVALLTFGEGWHNNHHAFQRSARHGMAWWELDLTYRTIQLLWACGLASNIHLPVQPAANGITRPVTDFDDLNKKLG